WHMVLLHVLTLCFVRYLYIYLAGNLFFHCFPAATLVAKNFLWTCLIHMASLVATLEASGQFWQAYRKRANFSR
ncbi:hypothetical protein ACJX0J_020910, partial [Zea mays]